MKKLFCMIIALLLTAVFAVSCAAAYDNTSSGEGYYDDGGYEMPAEEPEYYYEEEAPVESAAPAEDEGSKLSGLGDLGGNITANTQRKLVYSASYTIETEKYTDDYARIIAAAKKYNGYISGENSYGTAPEEYGDSGRTAELTVRIPVESYTAFTSDLSGIGYTVQKSQNTDDITSQYSDVESRIDLLETQYDKLAAHLENATKMSDIIELEEEMCRILNELDELKGTRRHYDDMVAYSTVDIILNEVVKQGEVSTSKQGFWDRASDGFSSTLVGVGSFFESLGVFLVAASPVLLILGVIFAAIFVPIALVRRKKRKKAASTPVESSTQDEEIRL